jgi:hypothetical protein
MTGTAVNASDKKSWSFITRSSKRISVSSDQVQATARTPDLARNHFR